MSRFAISQIPQIDARLLDTRDGLIKAAGEVHSAAQNTGFFYLSHHGIDSELIDTVFAAAKIFFDLTTAEKSTVAIDKTQRGWMATGMSTMRGATTHDLKEVFFWGPELAENHPGILAQKPLMAVNKWPDAECLSLCDTIVPYYNSVCDLARKLLRAIAIGFEVDADFFENKYQTPLARGQLVYYPRTVPSCDAKEQTYGVAPHTDFGMITLLLQDANGGLEIKTRDGNWLAATPVPGTLVCNIGDLLERWSNNRFRSTTHCVKNTSGRKRYSIPVFFDPDTDAVIDPNDLRPPRDQKTLFEPVTAGEYIVSRNKESFSQYK